jgi:hypothetical protein
VKVRCRRTGVRRGGDDNRCFQFALMVTHFTVIEASSPSCAVQEHRRRLVEDTHRTGRDGLAIR